MSFFLKSTGVVFLVLMSGSVRADSIPDSMLNQCIEFTRQVIGIKSGHGEACFIGKKAGRPSESCSLRIARDFDKRIGVIVPDWFPIFMSNEDIYVNRREGGYTTSYGLRCQINHGYFFTATHALFNVVYESHAPRQVYGGQSDYKNVSLDITMSSGVPTAFDYVAGFEDYTQKYIDSQPGHRSCVELKRVTCEDARLDSVRRASNFY